MGLPKREIGRHGPTDAVSGAFDEVHHRQWSIVPLDLQPSPPPGAHMPLVA
jgi:hypothetical protein